MTFLLTARAFLSRIPWQAWVIVGLLTVWAIDRTTYGARRFSDGRESVLTELRTAEAESLKKAAMAARNADKAGEQRALVEAETRAADLKAIERAEAEGRNPLDELF